LQQNKLDSGLTLIAQSTDFKLYNIKLFLTETEMLQLMKYGKRVIASLVFPAAVTTITSEQPIEFQLVQTPLVDLYEFSVTIFDDLTKYYHYAV
jgi:hypothetical protein